MWRKVRPIVLAVSVALNVALLSTWAVHAVPTHLLGENHAEETGQQDIWCPLHRELGVTEEQWEKIEPAMVRFQEKVRQQSQNLRKLRDEMLELLRSPDVDREKMEAQQEKIIRGHRKMQDIVLEHLLAEKRLLTDSQEANLFGMLADRMGCLGPMMGGGRGRGPGIGRVMRNMEGETSHK